MKIEINIEPQLEAIWKQIGFNDKEIDNEYAIISQKIQDLFISILSEFTIIAENLRSKVGYLESNLYHNALLIGVNSNTIKIDVNQPLKTRYEQASEQLYNFKNTFNSKAKNNNSLYELLTNLFDILEIPPEQRKNFKNEGENVNSANTEEAENLAFELKEAVDIRAKKMEAITKELDELHRKLRLDPISIPQTLGNETFSQYEGELNYLKEIYQNSISEKKKTLSKIHQIEDFFSIKSPDFVIESEKSENISCCDEKELDNLLKYLEKLQKEKARQVPEFIEQDKKILLDLYQELHFQTPSMQEFPALYFRTDNNIHHNSDNKHNNSNSSIETNSFYVNDRANVLNELEKEIEKINRYKEETSVIRDYLEKRDRILSMSKKKPKKYLSFNQVIANEKMITVDLPIINIQLEPLLEEFERKNGIPFMWDGEEVLIGVRKQNAKFQKKTGMVHSRYISTITNSKK